MTDAFGIAVSTCAGDAAAGDDVALQVVDGAGGQERTHLVDARETLAGRDRHARGGAYARQVLGGLRGDRLLEEEQLERLERVREADRVGRAQAAMAVEHQLESR